MKVFSTVGWMALFAGISWTIGKAVEGIDNWIHRVEKANDAMDSAVDEYKTIQSELESINSELEGQEKRIDELLAKDKLTYAEKGELEELQKITKELLIQQDIEAKRAERASKEVAQKTVDAYNTQYGKHDITKDDLQYKFDLVETNGMFPLVKDENDVTGSIAAYIRATELLTEAQEKYNKAVKNNEDTRWLEEDVQFYIDMVSSYEEQIENNISDLQEKRISLEEEYAKAIEKSTTGTSPLTTDEKETIETYESIANAIRLIYEYTNQSDWNNMEIDSIFNTKGIEKTKDELIEMAKSGELTPETIASYTNLNGAIESSEIFLKNGQTAAQAFCDEIYACAEAKDDLGLGNDTKAPILSFTDAISQVQSLSAGLDQLDKIYADVYNKEDFDWSAILNNDKFAEAFGTMGQTYEDFIRQISSAPDDLQSCQKAFDDLVTSYLYTVKDDNGASIFENLSASTRDATISLLEQMGVENAKIIVDTQLQAKELALQIGMENLDLANINAIDSIYGSINALLEQGDACGITATALYELIADQTVFSNSSLDTSQKIKELEKLAKAFGVTADSAISAATVTSKFTSMDGYNLSEEDVNSAILNSMSSSIEDKIADKFGSISANYKGGSSTKSAIDKASKESSKAEKEETAQNFDWIETRLKSVSKEAEKAGDAFDKAFGKEASKWTYTVYLSKLQDEVNANNEAITAYKAKLDQVGLSAEWVAKVQSGAFSIDSVTDEGLKTQISEYQTYYDKVVSCQSTLADLEERRLQASIDYAEKVIDTHEKEVSSIDKLIERRKKLVELKEVFNGSASKGDLSYQQKQTESQIELLEGQNKELYDLMWTTTYMDEAWTKYNDKIIDNNSSIKDLTQSLAELAVEMANLPIDKYESYLEKNSSKNDLYSAKLENATNAKAQNSIIDKQIKLAQNNDKKAQSTAVTTATNLNNSLKALSTAKSKDYDTVTIKGDSLGAIAKQKTNIDTYYKKVNGYTKSKKQIPSSLISQISDDGYASLSKACANYNAALTANETAQATAELSKITTQTDVAELTKQRFDNIQTQYERMQSLNTSQSNLLSSKMENATSRGYLASDSWYNQLISYQSENTSRLKKELSSLQSNLDSALETGKIVEYSDEWWDMTDSINSVTQSIQESKNAVQEYRNALQQLEFDNFDYLQEQISRLTSKNDYNIDLLSNNELTDDGGLTNDGQKTVKLHQENYDIYTIQAQKYADEIKQINAKLAKDPNNTTLIAQKQEYEDLQRQAILNAENEKQAIIDLQKNGYQSLINSLGDVISKYKELIQSAKDAHDYQNSISEKSETATNLRKQIAAYSSMSGNEEMASRLQQLNEDLKNAEKDIQETMYDKYISDTQDALDDALSGLEEFTNELVNNLQTTFENGVTTVSSKIDAIIKQVDRIIEASDKQADNAAYNTASGEYKDMSGVERYLKQSQDNSSRLKEQVDSANGKMQSASNKQYEALIRYGKNSKQYKTAHKQYLNELANYQELMAQYNNAQSILKDAKQQYSSIASENKPVIKEFLAAIASYGNSLSKDASSLDKKVYDITDGGILSAYNKKQLAELIGTSTSDSDILKRLKDIGFKTGGIGTLLKSSGEDGIAMVRNGEGFVSPEHVGAIQSLLNVVPDITKFVDVCIPDYSKILTGIQKPATVEVNVGDVILPNVQDAKQFSTDFIDSLKHDQQVKKALSSFVGTELTGGNSLGTNRF